MSLPAGARFGPYEILAPIGAGGMGEVYRARDTSPHRFVAINLNASIVVAQHWDEELRGRLAFSAGP